MKSFLFMKNTNASTAYGPVEFIVHLTIKKALKESVQRAQATFAEAASSFPGHIQSKTKEVSCDHEGMTSFIAIHSFDSSNHLVRWLESDKRRVLMQNFNSAFAGCFEVNYPQHPDGFSAWIPASRRDMNLEKVVPKWKMNAIVLVVLYPLTLILPDLVRQILPHSSKPTVQLITATAAVSLLGFWLVPLVSRWMTAWLYANRFVPQAIGGTCLAMFLYGIWQLAYLMKI